MFRLGVLGTDSTHVDAFIRHLNDERRHPPLRIVAALAHSPARDAEIRSRGLAVLPRVDDVTAACDGILVTHRVAGEHLTLAAPGLRAGQPTFVDKPLASSVADAVRLFELAEAHRAPLTSCSVLRLLPAVVAARGEGPAEVVVRGPADPASPYDGLFFGGIHLAEAACAVALPSGSPGGLPEDVRATRTTYGLRVEAVLGACRIRLDLQVESRGFAIEVDGRQHPFPLSADYLAPVTGVVHELMTGGVALDPGPTLAAVALLEQARAQLRG